MLTKVPGRWGYAVPQSPGSSVQARHRYPVAVKALQLTTKTVRGRGELCRLWVVRVPLPCQGNVFGPMCRQESAVKFCYGNLRAWVRLAVVVFIIVSVLFGLPVAGVCYLKLGYLQLVCPLGFTEICLASRRFYWDLFPAFLAVLGLVFLGGRLFCSWACPTSFLAAQTVRASRRVLPQRWVDAIDTWWRTLANRGPRLGFGDAMALLAGALSGILIFGHPFLSAICPVGVVTRNLIALFAHFRLRYDLLLIFLP